MNILFISTDSSYTEGPFGGAEFSMQLMAERLAKRNHNVNYVTIDRYGKKYFKPTIKIINNVTVHALRLISNPYQSSGKIFLNNIIKIVNAHYFGKILHDLIHSKKIQIIYSTYEHDLLNILLGICDRNCKLVVRMAGLVLFEECLKYPGLVKSWESILNRIDAVNYVSTGLEQLVNDKLKELNMKVKFKYTFCADIGTILTVINFNAYKRAPKNEFTMIMASRFSSYQKRQDIIIKAVSLIDPAFKLNVKLIGRGWEKRIINDLIEKLDVADRINLLPFMEQNQLWQEMANADLLCHACDYEGTSKIILESMALGLPVLASNVIPLSDYIKDSYNGFLVNNDPDLWAKRIVDIIQDEQLLLKVSQNAKSYVNEYHNPNLNVKTYEKEFQSIIQG